MVDKKVLCYWLICSLIVIVGIHLLDGALAIDDWIGFIVGISFGGLLLVGASIILAVLIAGFPFNTNETPGKGKIKQHLPVSTVLLSVFSIVAFIVTRPSYAREAPDEAGLCQIVKEGTFQLDDYIIERYGGVQTETDIYTQVKTAYKIIWITECEFELSNVDETKDITKIKITSVTPEAYTCVASSGGRTTRHEIKRLKSSN